MEIFNVVCPKCKKEFYADMLLYSLNVELHCPACGIYFLREKSPHVSTGGASTSAVARVAGGLSPEMIYRPSDKE